MKIHDIKNVTILGAGTMGHGIAEVALLAGYSVFLYDVAKEPLEKGKKLIDWSLNKFVKKSQISRTDFDKFIGNLTITIDFEEAAKNADLVIEAAPEILELKKALFRELDELCPKHTIFASNTSNISITELGAVTQRPQKVVGLHFSPPPVFAKMIEIVKGDETSDETLEIAIGFTKITNKVPLVSKDSPGFICNRIVIPSLLLMQLMLDRNEYSPATIDAAARNLGMVMGPYELQDYIGLDVIYHSMLYLTERLSEDYTPTSTLQKLVNDGKLGKKTGQGIYRWSNKGKPLIDQSNLADFDILDMMRLQINEAAKILEEGVANAEDIDTAMKLHYHNLWGPFEFAKTLDLNDLTKWLDELASKYNKKVFRAHKWIRDGTLNQYTYKKS